MGRFMSGVKGFLKGLQSTDQEIVQMNEFV